jgi:hypothetical protein
MGADMNNKKGLFIIGGLLIVVLVGFGTFYVVNGKWDILNINNGGQENIVREILETTEDVGNNTKEDSESEETVDIVKSNNTREAVTSDESTTENQMGNNSNETIADSPIENNSNEVITNSQEGINTTDKTDTTDINGTTDTTDTTDTADTTDQLTQEVFDSADERTPVKVKGIYVTGPMAGSKGMQDLIDLVDTTELNTMVIDIKNDKGQITYDMDLDAVQEIEADIHYVKDMKELVKKLKSKNIYLIARIVAFKDPILAEKKPELSIRNKDGSIFRDKSGLCWVNPYKKEVWDYLISIGKEAAALGFDEIQFDYIRFSTDSGMKNVDFGKDAKDKSKIKVITEFTKYACENLKPLGVYVSADVYGAIISSKIDSAIVGQSYIKMSKYLDYICPMIYPSHYADGAYGIEHPDLEPYNLILKAMQNSEELLKTNSDSNKVIVRPWLQDFTASWLTNYTKYDKKEVRAQIQAIYDAGYEEWILWNGSNIYTKDGLVKKN